MTIVEYFRDYYQERVQLRVAVLHCFGVLKGQDDYGELTSGGLRRVEESFTGELNGPMSFRKITTLELWKKIVMFL